MQSSLLQPHAPLLQYGRLRNDYARQNAAQCAQHGGRDQMHLLRLLLPLASTWLARQQVAVPPVPASVQAASASRSLALSGVGASAGRGGAPHCCTSGANCQPPSRVHGYVPAFSPRCLGGPRRGAAWARHSASVSAWSAAWRRGRAQQQAEVSPSLPATTRAACLHKCTFQKCQEMSHRTLSAAVLRPGQQYRNAYVG
jgi:hypothetical protein